MRACIIGGAGLCTHRFYQLDEAPDNDDDNDNSRKDSDNVNTENQRSPLISI